MFTITEENVDIINLDNIKIITKEKNLEIKGYTTVIFLNNGFNHSLKLINYKK